MNATAILDQLQRLGASIEIVDGKPRLRGTKVSPELLEQVRLNRAEILAEFDRRRAEDRDRYGRVPPADAPMLGKDIEFPKEWQEQIRAHVMRQPRPIHAWVMLRANAYFDNGTPQDDCEWRACVDVIAWQRNERARAAVEFLVGLPSNEELKIKKGEEDGSKTT